MICPLERLSPFAVPPVASEETSRRTPLPSSSLKPPCSACSGAGGGGGGGGAALLVAGGAAAPAVALLVVPASAACPRSSRSSLPGLLTGLLYNLVQPRLRSSPCSPHEADQRRRHAMYFAEEPPPVLGGRIGPSSSGIQSSSSSSTVGARSRIIFCRVDHEPQRPRQVDHAVLVVTGLISASAALAVLKPIYVCNMSQHAAGSRSRRSFNLDLHLLWIDACVAAAGVPSVALTIK